MYGSALILHVREKMQFFAFQYFPGDAEILVRRCWITNHRSIAHSLSNILPENYQTQLICDPVTVCKISVVF